MGARPLPCSLQELFYEDRHFHEGCFRCCRCKRSLADEPFTCQDNELLCNDCYCSAFSSQCSACGETVMPGTSPEAPPCTCRPDARPLRRLRAWPRDGHVYGASREA